MNFRPPIVHPELGYFDEGLDLTGPQVYAQSTEPFGRAQVLTPTAYRSKVFADMEDEKVWTRNWVCVGSEQEIPDPGDLLPFTVGNHGIHVQREGDGRLVGRFSKAQHGGCRSIPAQCQTGRKTKCSFTSCGYSRDPNVIKADELGENTPAMHQYLGLRPERLSPVRVETWGPLIFVNLDDKAAPVADQVQNLQGCPSPYVPAGLRDVGGFWSEYSSNWKLSGKILTEHSGGLELNGVGTPSGEMPAESSYWVFPNLLLVVMSTYAVSIVLQPTSTTATLQRVRIFVDWTVSDDKAGAASVEKIQARWEQVLHDAGRTAEALQQTLSEWATPSRPDTTMENLPIETDYRGYCFQRLLIDCVLAEYEYYWANPLYSNPVV